MTSVPGSPPRLHALVAPASSNKQKQQAVGSVPGDRLRVERAPLSFH